MREIKFRYIYKNMRTGAIRKQVFTLEAIENSMMEAYQPRAIEIVLSRDEYTGLKDKNGVEIYEGDCLGGIWGPGWIVWCEECKSFEYFWFEIGCSSCEGELAWYELVKSSLEVIGNIYENPLEVTE